MADAIRILQAEHVNMAKVLAVLDAEMKVFHELGKLDLDLLFTIIDYIESFPDEFHHPKEERLLFDVLARRNPQAKPLIDELRAQHSEGKELIAGLKAAVEALSIEAPMNKAEFEKTVSDYTAFVREHMRKEETALFPLARESLEAEDWSAIDREFAENEDPMFSGAVDERYQELLRRIVYLSLPPFAED